MKFAHIADCHIGAWRDPKLKDLSMKAFIKAADICIERKVDFILIAGDLFNTSMPGIDHLKETTRKLKQLMELNIPVYMIPGSHDQSPSGKTMLDVLEEAGLMINVFKGKVEQERLVLDFTIDKKTGSLITGIMGRRGMLDRKYYEYLTKANLERTQGTKIFMFHTAISELTPPELEKMDSSPLSFLPKGFEYYAGGHVHIVKNQNFEGYKNVVFPGPLMPSNFSELEKLRKGSFYIYNHGKLEVIPIELVNVYPVEVDANNKSPEDVFETIEQFTKSKDFSKTIVLIRVFGKLRVGKPSDINFNELFKKLFAQKAFYIMKNTSKLTSEEFEEIKISSSSVEEVENNIIKEHLGQIKTCFSDKEEEITKNLIKALSEEKNEGEKVYEYNERMKKEIEKIIGF
ncbi:MAG: exonuclease SbcCD subunit D [Nanoarchaeota archaeon]|nr:exonuclease SbcCD subunit D [Nanoarchaeota archaeon]MBU1854624.1 exonuclease SbcCD subunit D [Nanoarchaeota archaeon]